MLSVCQHVSEDVCMCGIVNVMFLCVYERVSVGPRASLPKERRPKSMHENRGHQGRLPGGHIRGAYQVDIG